MRVAAGILLDQDVAVGVDDVVRAVGEAGAVERRAGLALGPAIDPQLAEIAVLVADDQRRVGGVGRRLGVLPGRLPEPRQLLGRAASRDAEDAAGVAALLVAEVELALVAAPAALVPELLRSAERARAEPAERRRLGRIPATSRTPNAPGLALGATGKPWVKPEAALSDGRFTNWSRDDVANGLDCQRRDAGAARCSLPGPVRNLSLLAVPGPGVPRPAR
jgi:hypothetical protein